MLGSPTFAGIPELLQRVTNIFQKRSRSVFFSFIYLLALSLSHSVSPFFLYTYINCSPTFNFVCMQELYEYI